MRKTIIMLLLLAFAKLSLQGQTLSADLDALMQKHYSSNTPGAALWVFKQGKILKEQGYGLGDLDKQTPVSTHTHFRMASVSKQITALSTYRLIQEGKLQFDTSIGTLFTGLAPAVQAITVTQLLQHTSGIWDYESLIPEDQKDQVLDADVLQLIRGVDSTYFTPGTQFRYSNTGYCLLALIVAKVSGKTYADFARQTIFEPLGMHTTLLFEKAGEAEIQQRAYGYHQQAGKWVFADQSLTSATQGDGGVYTSISEYGLWVQALIKGAGWLKDYLHTIQTQAVPVKDKVQYSMGWFLYPGEQGGYFLFHSGESTGFHNIVYINPRKQEAAVLFTNRDDMKIAPTFQSVLQRLDMAEAWTKKVDLFTWLNQTY